VSDRRANQRVESAPGAGASQARRVPRRQGQRDRNAPGDLGYLLARLHSETRGIEDVERPFMVPRGLVYLQQRAEEEGRRHAAQGSMRVKDVPESVMAVYVAAFLEESAKLWGSASFRAAAAG
jgi:hypothetical protein